MDLLVLETNMKKRVLLVLAFLCVVGGGASAQINLLPQGSFENPGVDTGWAEGFRIPQNQEFQVISEGGKHWLRIENRDAGRQLDYSTGVFEIADLTVAPHLGSRWSARARRSVPARTPSTRRAVRWRAGLSTTVTAQ